MFRYVLAFLFSTVISCAAFGQTQNPIRVLCGGKAYTDSKGQQWQADYGYNEGTAGSNSATISGTADPTLYHYGRWNGDAAVPLTYSFPVANGTYHVNLYFAETSTGMMQKGARIFNVRMQNQLIFSDLDVYSLAGADTALVKGADITVMNGQIEVELDGVVQNPKVNAIEILQTSAAPELKLNFLYPDGSAVTGNLLYNIVSSQITLSGTQPLQSGTATCYLFASPAALGLSGTFQVNLSLQDAAGHTLWQVNLALDPATVSIGAVQGSTLSVVVQKQ